jgi:hypothetical protein
MKLSALLLLVPLAVPFVPRAAQESGGEHESELARQMEAIEDLVKPLRKHLRPDGSRAEALAALVDIQRLSFACKMLVPEIAAKLPESERAVLVTAYRRTMVDFLLRQLELEGALLDGDEAAIQAAFDRFREMEDSAHERFAPEED